MGVGTQNGALPFLSSSAHLSPSSSIFVSAMVGWGAATIFQGGCLSILVIHNCLVKRIYMVCLCILGIHNCLVKRISGTPQTLFIKQGTRLSNQGSAIVQQTGISTNRLTR